MTKRITVSLRNRIQVYPKTERQIHILLQILLTENPIISIKLTVKLKKEGLENPALEVRHMCSLLQMVAGITVNNGHQFTPGQFLAMGQQRGLDAASKSAITGFITKEDDIGTVESPFGKVQLVQLIGVKAEEIEQMKNKTMTPAQLAEILKDGLTDYKR